MSKKFVIYESWATLLSNIPKEQAGELIQAICKMKLGQEVDIQDPSVAGMFAMIAPQIEKDSQKYDEKCERLKANAEKSKQKNSKSESISSKSESKTNKSDSETSKSAGKSIYISNSIHPSDVKEKENARANKPVRKKYGEFRHVLLTDEEYNRLVEKNGKQETDAAIKEVDRYCEETGKKYQNYNLTIQRWGYDAAKKEARGKPPDKPKATSFNGNFRQRDYNYDDLEAQLMRAQGAT